MSDCTEKTNTSEQRRVCMINGVVGYIYNVYISLGYGFLKGEKKKDMKDGVVEKVARKYG